MTMLAGCAASVIGASADDNVGGRVETGLQIASARLGHDIPYALYTPQSGLSQAGPLPVLYLLHGRDDNERAWLEWGKIATTLDRMIEEGAIQPMAVVMPMAANSWYVDDVRVTGGYGAFATALSEDFIPAIERRHGFASCGTARAIGGLSMGGYGALLQALTRPAMFRSVFSLSGSLFSDLDVDIQPRLPFYHRVLSGIYGEPFDVERFKSWTIFARLRAAPPEVAGLGVWLAAGDRDFSSIVTGTVRLHQELRERKIETHLRIDDGEHTWSLWSAAVQPALVWVSSRMRAQCNQPLPPRDPR